MLGAASPCVRRVLCMSLMGLLTAVLVSAQPPRQAGTIGKKQLPEGMVPVKAELLWPIHVSSLPLTSSVEMQGLEPKELATKMTSLGLNMFKQYTEATLPKELQLDAEFEREFRVADHSRLNEAFRRWQKRVFADRHRFPAEELSGRGEQAPRLKGIDYKWPELYEAPEYRTFLQRATDISLLYLKRSGYNSRDLPKNFRIFAWAEVYRMGEYLRPWARTQSAYLMGRYFPNVRKGAMKLNFEDPRGINPPYGKTHSHQVYEGIMVLFPTWASNFISPNMFNKTAVCWSFIVYPPAGDEPLDWEDDPTSSLVVPQTNIMIRKPTEKTPKNNR